LNGNELREIETDLDPVVSISSKVARKHMCGY